MANVQLAGGNFGGLIQGNFGNYQVAADGTFTVDTRDAPAMLALGMNYTKMVTNSYAPPLAAAAATVGAIYASAALSNATLTIAANPDVMRPVVVEVGVGTTAITAGTLTVAYVANDGRSQTDVISLVSVAGVASTPTFTLPLSKGVVSIASAVVAGLVGGHTPWIRLNTTTALSVPVDPGAVDFAVVREYDNGATIAVGALTAALGSITPTTAPGTSTYSFAYTYTAPTA